MSRPSSRAALAHDPIPRPRPAPERSRPGRAARPPAVLLPLLLLAILVLTAPARAPAQLSCLETDDMRLVYIDPLQTWIVPHVARCFENSLRMQRRIFDYEPTEKITVILVDFTDYGNGGAGAVPRNGLIVYIAPSSFLYETYPGNERINTLMNHELVHIANFDKSGPADRFWRHVFFGKVGETAEHPETILYAYLTAPRTAAPRWYHEGVAVFTETWMADGIGRAQGSYDEMVFRAMVRDGSRFYDPLGLVSEGTKADFQLEMNSYLYGTRFFTYLAYVYGPDAVYEWYKRDDGSKAYFASQFEQVFGKSLDRAWADWIAFERGFQQRNLETIRTYPITPHRDVSRRALGSISRPWYDRERGKVYVGMNYPGALAHVGAIDLATGEIEHLRDIKGPMMYGVTSLAFDPDGDRLFYTTDNGDWRDLVELDPGTGRQRRLQRDLRVGELAIDPRDHALWGIRHLNGLCTLVRIPEPYDDWFQVHTFDYGRIVYDLDISPDGRRLVAAIGEIDGSHAVHVMPTDSLLAGSLVETARFDFGNTIPGNFIFGPEGRWLYGSSYQTGVSNIFRYDLQADSLQCLSNTETGLFRPLPVSADSLLVFRYTGDGFLPTMIGIEPVEDVAAIRYLGAELWEARPQVRTLKAPSPAGIPLESLITYQGPYRALSGIELESAVPVVEGYKDEVAYGAHLRFSDPVSLHSLDGTVTYSPVRGLPDRERLHARLDYHRYDWRLGAAWNPASFYDLFGPTKIGRKGYRLAAGHTRTLVYDTPRELSLDLDVAYWGDLERLPDYQNVAASYSELLTGSVRLAYRNLRFSLGAVDYEKGLTWSLDLTDNHVNGRSLPQGIATIDVGHPFLFHHSSLWLRTAGGLAPGEHDNPFANFYFGGFGNNWVDRGEIRRYRDWYAFPGLELNEAGGTSFTRGLLDWNLPPLRFRRLGKPAFYATWLRTSLFAAGLVTNPGNDALRRTIWSVGTQADLRLGLLSHLETTASFGYAMALERGYAPRDEVMVSLKIIR